MKIKILTTILPVLALILALSSCFEDDSTIADFRHPEIVINKSSDPEGDLKAYYLKNFHYEPKLGIPEGKDTIYLNESNFDNYEYEWSITLTITGRVSTPTEVISNKRVLDILMDVVLPENNTYILILRVTDKENGICFTFDWKIKVLSDIGPGILVAETEDGQNSDVSLLMTKAYNGDFNEDSEDVIHRNLFSKANNGNKLPGLITTLTHMSSYGDKTINALVKEKALYGIDPVSYQVTAQNEDFFFFKPDVFKPQAIGCYVAGTSYLINDGKLLYYELRYGQKYNYVGKSDFDFHDKICYSPHSGSYYLGGMVIVQDKLSKGLVAMDNYGRWIKYQDNTEGAFNPANLGGVKMIYGNVGTNGSNNRMLLMKSEDSDRYFVYKLTATTPKKPIGGAIYDLNNCPDLVNSSSYAFSEVNEEFYYGVGNELKVVILNSGQPSSKVSYTLPGTEEITHILIHKRSGITTWNEAVNPDTGNLEPLWRESRNNIITVVSFDASKNESVIRTLPIQFGGTGGIADEKYVKTYRGFNKIIAVTTQI